MQGGAGYILSKEALRRFAEIGYSNATFCRTDPGGYEDVEMGYCMERLGCRGIDTRDSFGRNRFLPLQLERHLQLGPPSDQFWFWDYIFYPVKDASVFNVTTSQTSDLFWILTQGFDCCSDTAIGFHKVQPEQMYLFEYLIYHVNPYGSAQVRHQLQSTPAPPPDASLKVVATFLQSFELP
jgi:glycoprotein-N-acetylgalactosamine 3-beta-galactosyltransferase